MSDLLPVVRKKKKVKPVSEGSAVKVIENERKRGSRFADHLPNILDENNDLDMRTKATRVAAFEMLVTLIPAAEKRVRDTDSTQGIYQLISLLQTMQTTMSDLDGERDLAMMIQLILDGSIYPKLMVFANMIAQGQSHVKRTLKMELRAEDYKLVAEELDAYNASLGEYVKGMHRDIQESVNIALKGK